MPSPAPQNAVYCENKGFMSMPNHDYPCYCDACKSWNEFFNQSCREYAFNIEKNKKDRLLNDCLLDARKKRKPDDCEIVSKVKRQKTCYNLPSPAPQSMDGEILDNAEHIPMDM